MLTMTGCRSYNVVFGNSWSTLFHPQRGKICRPSSLLVSFLSVFLPSWFTFWTCLQLGMFRYKLRIWVSHLVFKGFNNYFYWCYELLNFKQIFNLFLVALLLWNFILTCYFPNRIYLHKTRCSHMHTVNGQSHLYQIKEKGILWKSPIRY